MELQRDAAFSVVIKSFFMSIIRSERREKEKDL